MEVNERMRERIKYSWIIREKFSCVKCGASDKNIGWNDKGSRHPQGEPEGVLFCKKCKHKLTEQKELEELVPFVQTIEYRFFLRFIKKDFELCAKCQEDFDEAIRGRNWVISREETPISIVKKTMRELDGLKDYLYFTVAFLSNCIMRGKFEAYELIPCKKCQEELAKILEEANWILGNKDYDDPPIELKRTWIDDDRRSSELYNGGLIRFNGKDNFGICQQCLRLDYLGCCDGKWLCEKCEQRHAEDTLLDIELTRQKEESN